MWELTDKGREYMEVVTKLFEDWAVSAGSVRSVSSWLSEELGVLWVIDDDGEIPAGLGFEWAAESLRSRGLIKEV